MSLIRKDRDIPIEYKVARRAIDMSWDMAKGEQASAIALLQMLSDMFAEMTGTKVICWEDNKEKTFVFPKVTVDDDDIDWEAESIRSAVESDGSLFGWKDDDGKGFYFRRYGKNEGCRFSVVVVLSDEKCSGTEKNRVSLMADAVFGNVTYIFNAEAVSERENPLSLPDISYYFDATNPENVVNRLGKFRGAAYLRPAGFDNLTINSYAPLMRLYREWLPLFRNNKFYRLALDCKCLVVLIKGGAGADMGFSVEMGKIGRKWGTGDSKPVFAHVYHEDTPLTEKELVGLMKEVCEVRDVKEVSVAVEMKPDDVRVQAVEAVSDSAGDESYAECVDEDSYLDGDTVAENNEDASSGFNGPDDEREQGEDRGASFERIDNADFQEGRFIESADEDVAHV